MWTSASSSMSFSALSGNSSSFFSPTVITLASAEPGGNGAGATVCVSATREIPSRISAATVTTLHRAAAGDFPYFCASENGTVPFDAAAPAKNGTDLFGLLTIKSRLH